MTQPVIQSGTYRDVLTGAAYGVVAALMLLPFKSSGIGGLLLVLLAPVPLFLAGFDQGLRASLTAAAVTIAGIGLWGAPFSVLGEMALLLLGPVCLLSWLALQPTGEREGRLVLGLVAVGAVQMVLLWLSLPDEAALSEALMTVMGIPAHDPQAPVMAQLAAFTRRWFALGAVMCMVWLSLSGALAAMLAGLGKAPAIPRLWIARAGLPRWYMAVLAVLLVAGAFGPDPVGLLASNLFVVGLAGVGLVGLGVVHTLFWRYRIGALGRIGFYGCLVVLSSFVVWPVVALGLIEQWAGLRNRIRAARARADEE